jgi:hypothetical protein
MKIIFTTAIKRFDTKGEKTGWSYIDIPAEHADKLNPGIKKSFRVKGRLDNYKIEKTSLLPMGNGDFILPINKTIRTKIKKGMGAMLKVELLLDEREPELDKEMMTCLKEEPAALAAFRKLPGSHQRYYSKWVADAKTDATKAKRIAKTINGMLNHLTFPEILKSS